MKNYLILFVLLFIIYIIYINKQNIKQSKINKKSKKKIKRKLKGGSFLDDFNTNEFLIKYIKTDSSDSNLYISRNENNENELVTINRNELLQTDPTVWKIEYNTALSSGNSYSINGKYGSLFAAAEEPEYFIELNETNYNFKFKNFESDVEKYLFVDSNNNLIESENQGSLFKLEPYRLGLPIEINNRINLFSNVVDKMNTNNFECEFNLNFNQIYFSELNNGSSKNFLTNKTEIFNIFILPDQIKNFNNKYNDDTEVKNYVNNSGSSQKIIFDKNEYILTNSSISDSIYKKNDIFKASDTQTSSRAENKFTFKYDITDNSFEIYTFDGNNPNNTGQLITKKLENNFVLYVNVGETQHNIFLDNDELKISSDNFTTFKIINIIEKSTGYFCDIIKKDNGNIFSFSRNIKVNDRNNLSRYNDVVDRSEVFRIELIRISNKYKIKNLSDNRYLHLISDKLKWKNGVRTANLFELNNIVNQNPYKFYLEKIASKNNTYKIKYEYLEQKKYLGCSDYKGKIVETDEDNASEFIIIPYEEEFIDSNKFDQIKNAFNIDSQTLLNKIAHIPFDIDSKTFSEINDIYVNSCIKKELFSYLLFKIYYNNLNLSDNNEFNLEENSINIINIILNCIDENIKNLQENYYGSYLDTNEIEDYIEVINNIFTIENDLNLTLKNLFYVLHINDIETEITQSNSKFSMDYFNKYNGELFCIGNDYNNKNNLSISITKKNWLNDGPLHYFDSNKKVIDVCIFSKIRNEKFIKVENKSTDDNINYDIKIIDVELDTSLDTLEKQANNIYKHKHLILKFGYLNNGSYFIDSINDNSDSYSLINFSNNRTNFKLEKISNKKYEFYIYIIDQNGNKSYLNDNGDKTSEPTTIWYIMPPGYVKDYYEKSIITPSELTNNKYYIKLTSGPNPTHTGYLAAQKILPNDNRSGGVYVMVHKNKNEASEFEIEENPSDDTFKIKCVGGKNAVINQWLACHKYSSRDKRDHDSQGLLSAYMMTHGGDIDASIFKIENKELKIVDGHPTWNVPGYVACHDWYDKDRRDNKSVYLMCWRGSLKNIFKFENVNQTTIVEETNDILVDKHYLNIKTYSSNNISISLENVINDAILPNNINFRFIYNRPYIKVLVDNGIESKYLDKNGNLVDSDNILSNHYLEIPYYNNPYIVVGSSNLNYSNNDIFKKNEHLVYIKNETINKYLNVLKHNKSDKTPISFKALTETENNSNIELDKYTNTHLDFMNISQESSIENPTLEQCKAEALTNNNYNYIRYVTSQPGQLPSGWVSLRGLHNDPDYDWYYTSSKNFNNLTEAQTHGNSECARVHMGVMGSGEDWADNEGSLCRNGWFSDRRGYYQKITGNPAACGYKGWNPGRTSESSREYIYTLGSGNIMCKVPKQRKSNCTLLKTCDNFNNDARYTVYKKNSDADNGFDEGISGWCSSFKVNTQNTTENLYPDEFLWRLIYTGSLNKFRLINTEAPNIIIDNIDLIKIDDTKYLFKKGSMYLSESNNVAKFNTTNEAEGHKMNIIPYKKITSNSFLNSKFKLNRQITNFTFTNPTISNETNYESIHEKNINLSLNRIFIFNINITYSVASSAIVSPVINTSDNSIVSPSGPTVASIGGSSLDTDNIFKTNSYDGTVQILRIYSALSLYFSSIDVNKKYNIFMSKKGINEYDLIGRYHLPDLQKKYPINTNISKASFAGSWSCSSRGCNGNLYVRDIDYHYDNITKNATNIANYYDFKLIEEKILFSITEDNSSNDKVLLEKIIVSLSNNNLLVYSYLEPVDTTITHSSTFTGGNYFYYKLHVNKKLENGITNITLKLVPKNEGYSLLVMTNNKNTNSEGTKMLDIIENINLHSLFSGTITDYSVSNFNINFKYLQYNNPPSSNIIKNGYNYKIKHKKSGKYLSLIRNKLTLDNNHRRRFKIHFIKVLHTEHKISTLNTNIYFHYDANKMAFRYFNQRWKERGVASKREKYRYIDVYNYTTGEGPFKIEIWTHPHPPDYFVDKNPTENIYNKSGEYNYFGKNFKTGHGRLEPNGKSWKFNTNDILIFTTKYSGATLKEQIENNKEDIDYEIKNYEDSSKTETCLVSENDLKVNKNKIIVLDAHYKKNGAGGELEGGYFNFHTTTKQQNIFKKNGGQDLYVYNPRHNNYYKIHVKLNNNLSDSEKDLMSDTKYSSNILENKKPNAQGQLKIKITRDQYKTIYVGPYEGTKIVDLPEDVTEVIPRPTNHMDVRWRDRFNLEIVNNDGKRQLHIQRNDTDDQTKKCLYDEGDHRGWGMELYLNGIIPGQEKNLLEASQQEKQYENISFDKFFEKDDVLIYYYEKNDPDNFTNINRLREYVATNCLPNTSDISNKWSIIEENGKYKFYNDYFNTYLGENNIANYDNGVDFNKLQRGYKEKINNTEFTLENTSVSSHYGIKNIENNKRIYGLWNGDESFNFHLKDSLYKSMITYFRSHLSENASFEFIQETVNSEHEKTDYVTKRNIYNNNRYLPKIHHRYRIRNKLFNDYLGIDNTNTGKMTLNFTSSFDVIYINNNYIFYNVETDKFLGEYNIDIQLNIEPDYIKEIRQEEKLPLNNLTVTKIYFKLENVFINNCFYMKNVETGKYIVISRDKRLKYYRFENLDPHFMYEFELIGETPFNTQQNIRNRLKNILRLTDY